MDTANQLSAHSSQDLYSYPAGVIYSDPKAQISIVGTPDCPTLVYASHAGKLQITYTLAQEDPAHIRIQRVSKERSFLLSKEESVRHTGKIVSLLKNTAKYRNLIEKLQTITQQYSPDALKQHKENAASTEAPSVSGGSMDITPKNTLDLTGFKKIISSQTKELLVPAIITEANRFYKEAQTDLLTYVNETYCRKLREHCTKIIDTIRRSNLRKKIDRLLKGETLQNLDKNEKNKRIEAIHQLIAPLIRSRLNQSKASFISSFRQDSAYLSAGAQLVWEHLTLNTAFNPEKAVKDCFNESAQVIEKNLMQNAQLMVAQQMIEIKKRLDLLKNGQGTSNLSAVEISQKKEAFTQALCTLKTRQTEIKSCKPLYQKALREVQQKVFDEEYIPALQKSAEFIKEKVAGQLSSEIIPAITVKILDAFVQDYLKKIIDPIIWGISDRNQSDLTDTSAPKAVNEVCDNTLQEEYRQLFNRNFSQKVAVYQDTETRIPTFFVLTADTITEAVMDSQNPSFYTWEKDGGHPVNQNEFPDFFSALEPLMELHPELTETICNVASAYKTFCDKTTKITQHPSGNQLAQRKMVERFRSLNGN